jgi:ribose/xylose/arabinose/galactoside ABC-type transport system permease subunit
MKQNLLLTITSLLSILLMTFHLTDDIVRGMDKARPANLIAIAILVVWLYGTLVLTERRPGYIITLIGGIIATGMPVIHLRGTGIVNVVKSSGGFFFLWTLFALGVLGIFSIILSVRGLWSLRRTTPD